METICRYGSAHPASTPRVVLLDLWLEQRGDGWKVLYAMRQDTVPVQLPVIMCTADQQAVQDEVVQPGDLSCAAPLKRFDKNTLFATGCTVLKRVD